MGADPGLQHLPGEHPWGRTMLTSHGPHTRLAPYKPRHPRRQGLPGRPQAQAPDACQPRMLLRASALAETPETKRLLQTRSSLGLSSSPRGAWMQRARHSPYWLYGKSGCADGGLLMSGAA